MITGILALLTATSSVSTLVGSRVYVNKAPQKAVLPYVILTQLNSEEYPTLDGLTSVLRTVTIDADCKGRTFPEVQSLAEAVKALLKDYSGAAGTYTVGAVLYNGEVHDFEPPSDGSDNGNHVITLDFDIQYNP